MDKCDLMFLNLLLVKRGNRITQVGPRCQKAAICFAETVLDRLRKRVDIKRTYCVNQNNKRNKKIKVNLNLFYRVVICPVMLWNPATPVCQCYWLELAAHHLLDALVSELWPASSPFYLH